MSCKSVVERCCRGFYKKKKKGKKPLSLSLSSVDWMWSLKQTSGNASEINVHVLYDFLRWNFTEISLMNWSSFRHMLLGDVFC